MHACVCSSCIHVCTHVRRHVTQLYIYICMYATATGREVGAYIYNERRDARQHRTMPVRPIANDLVSCGLAAG